MRCSFTVTHVKIVLFLVRPLKRKKKKTSKLPFRRRGIEIGKRPILILKSRCACCNCTHRTVLRRLQQHKDRFATHLQGILGEGYEKNTVSFVTSPIRLHCNEKAGFSIFVSRAPYSHCSHFH